MVKNGENRREIHVFPVLKLRNPFKNATLKINLFYQTFLIRPYPELTLRTGFTSMISVNIFVSARIDLENVEKQIIIIRKIIQGFVGNN